MRDRNKGMGRLGNQTANEVNADLKNEELEVLAKTAVDWEALKPQVADPELYDRLIAIVRDSTEKNESIGRLKTRIKGMGNEAVALAKKVASMIR